MAATTTELMVRLVADTKGFAAELSGATRDVDALQAKAVRMGTAMQDVGRRMTLGFTVPFVAGMGLAVKAASDLEQAVGATESVFGPAAGEVERYAKRAVDAVGLSERAYRELAAVSGAQFKNLGLSQREAAKESDRLIKIGADLAATFGGTTADAVNALQAAFRGEADPAERFGLRLNINTVNAKALEMGLAKTTAEVDNHARQQATMALIVEQSAGALGQFQRESGTSAVQLQKARAEIENAGAALGSALLPILADVAGAVANVAQWFANLPGPVKTAIVAFGGLVAAAGPFLWISGSIIKNVATLTEAFPGLGRSIMAATAAAGPWIIAAGLMAAAIYKTQDALRNGDGEWSVYTQNLMRLTDAQLANAGKLLLAKQGYDEFARTIKQVASESSTTAQKMVEGADLPAKARERLLGVIEKEIEAQQRAAAAAQADQNALAGLSAEADGAANNLDDLKTAFDNLTASQFDVEQSSINMERAIENLNQSVIDGKAGTLEGRQAFLDAQRGIEDWGSAVRDNAAAAGQSTADAVALQVWKLGELAGTLAPGSPLRTWLESYINDLSRIPSEVKTTLTIAGRTYNIGPDGGVTDYNPLGIPGFSQGGWVGGTGNGDTVPAMLTPGEFVLSKDMLAGRQSVPAGVGGGVSSAGAGPMVVNIYDATDPERVMNAIVRAVSNGASVPPRVRAAFSN